MGDAVRYAPEVIVLSDDQRAAFEPLLEPFTEGIERAMAETPTLADLLQRNGWTPRMLAWGQLLDFYKSGV